MSIENPAVPLSSIVEDDAMYDTLTGGEHSHGGVKVSARKALGLSSVWRGVNLISGDIGRYPFTLYRYMPGTGLAKQPDILHPAARVMRRPNDYMTPFTFRETLQAHALLYGNGYAYIVRSDFDGAPLELLPLDPARTWPVRAGGELWYLSQVAEPLPGKRRKKNSYVKIRSTEMLHIKGLGFDGLCGYSVLKIMRETLGGAIAARDYGGRYFKNDASPGVVIQVPAGMPERAIANLRQTWDALHIGFRNAHKIAILRDGVTLANYSKATAKDAQMLESRAFDAREVANVLGVPPHKLGDPSRTAYNSLESENQSYREDTLSRWFAVWEQECFSKLLTESEKAAGTHGFYFDPQPLSSVPLSQRGAYYSQAITGGWLAPDEARAYENLNPRLDGTGGGFSRPLNTAPTKPTAPDVTPAADPPVPAGDDADRSALAALVADLVVRMLRDAKFTEDKHPRKDNGEFGSGSGGSKSGDKGGKEKDKGKSDDKDKKKDKGKDDKAKDKKDDKDKGKDDTGKASIAGAHADAIHADLDKQVGGALKSKSGLMHAVKVGALKVAVAALAHVETWNSAAFKVATALYGAADTVLDTAEDMTKKLGYNPAAVTAGHVGTHDGFKSGFAQLTGSDSPVSGHIAAKIAATVLSHIFMAIKRKVTGRSDDGADGFTQVAETIRQVFDGLNSEFNMTGAPSTDDVVAVLKGVGGD